MIWCSVLMSWNYVHLRIKNIRQTQDGPKRLWIGPRIEWLGPRIGLPIFSTLMGCWQNRTSQRSKGCILLLRWLVWFIQWPIMLRKWVIWHVDLFRGVFVHLALLYMSDFWSYVYRLGKLWFCYIMQKLFSSNPGIFLQIRDSLNLTS